ncbi:Uncharacterised protein [Mycobacterium tuberculosis]|nr:Uncharacterised protein [Mycobacterium tuberculosis]
MKVFLNLFFFSLLISFCLYVIINMPNIIAYMDSLHWIQVTKEYIISLPLFIKIFTGVFIFLGSIGVMYKSLSEAYYN